MKRKILVLLVASVLTGIIAYRATRPTRVDAEAPAMTEMVGGEADAMTIDQLLDLAETNVSKMSQSLRDYRGTFIKQERDSSGVLGPPTKIQIVARTKFGEDGDVVPRRVYLKFLEPKDKAGREVIWAQDLYEGQMAVHETTALLSWKTLWLNPTGMIAMQGQRYPVSEIGLVRLAEKLVERGQKLRGRDTVKIIQDRDAELDGRPVWRFRIEKLAPDPAPANNANQDDDDFAVAEVVMDPQRNLLLSYRSFDWPKSNKSGQSGGNDSASELPLIESYQYRDVETNVGLSDLDFDVKNPAYGFPDL
ncbi:MAG: DUF1571 domain-containing protein [Planctomycetota bacterium]